MLQQTSACSLLMALMLPPFWQCVGLIWIIMEEKWTEKHYQPQSDIWGIIKIYICRNLCWTWPHCTYPDSGTSDPDEWSWWMMLINVANEWASWLVGLVFSRLIFLFWGDFWAYFDIFRTHFFYVLTELFTQYETIQFNTSLIILQELLELSDQMLVRLIAKS